MKHGVMSYKRSEKDAVSEASVVKASLWEKGGEFSCAFCLPAPFSFLLHCINLHYQKSICTLVGNVVLLLLWLIQFSQNQILLSTFVSPRRSEHTSFFFTKYFCWSFQQSSKGSYQELQRPRVRVRPGIFVACHSPSLSPHFLLSLFCTALLRVKC